MKNPFTKAGSLFSQEFDILKLLQKRKVGEKMFEKNQDKSLGSLVEPKSDASAVSWMKWFIDNPSKRDLPV